MLTWFPQFNSQPHPFSKICSSNEPDDSEISSRHKDTHTNLQGDVGEGGEGEGGGGGGGWVGERDRARLLRSRFSSEVKIKKTYSGNSE